MKKELRKEKKELVKKLYSGEDLKDTSFSDYLVIGNFDISVDEEEFDRLMIEQKQRARNARKNPGAEAWEGESDPFAEVEPTDFVGYTEYEADAKIGQAGIEIRRHGDH